MSIVSMFPCIWEIFCSVVIVDTSARARSSGAKPVSLHGWWLLISCPFDQISSLVPANAVRRLSLPGMAVLEHRDGDSTIGWGVPASMFVCSHRPGPGGAPHRPDLP